MCDFTDTLQDLPADLIDHEQRSEGRLCMVCNYLNPINPRVATNAFR